MILITLHNAFKRATSFFSITKIPAYFIIGFGLYFFAPGTALAFGLRFLLSLAMAPLVYEVFSAAITISLVLVFRLLTPRFLNNERLLDYAITQDNNDRAIEIVNRSQSSDLLVSFGVRLIASNTNMSVFNAIVARLAAMNPNQLAYNENQLLRASIFHGRKDQFNTLLSHAVVSNNAHANDNEALKEACIQGDSDFVGALLALPNVALNAHHNGNEALRLAQQHGHLDIVQLLLNNPQVSHHLGQSVTWFSPRRTTEYGIVLAPTNTQAPQPAVDLYPNFFSRRWLGARSFFGNNTSNEDDDRVLRNASQRESSMASLSARQGNAFEEMQRKYQSQFNQKGVEGIFDEIKCYLRTEYAINPARTYFGIQLPFNIGLFNFLINNQGYYQHRAHTAYRYLFLSPNHWASIVSNRYLSDTARSHIAYMWLAATDKTRKLPDNYTREEILREFTTAIYELCRAHNYDRYMPVLRSRRAGDGSEEIFWANESYDDLEGDKPTCDSGSTQRIVQFYMVFLNEDPTSRPLTSDLVKTKFVQEMVNESTFAATMYNKLKTMDAKTLQQVHDAIEKKAVMFEELTSEEKATIAKISYSPSEVEAIVDEFKKYYGASRIEQNHTGELPAFARREFISYERMIRTLSQEAYIEFGDHLMRSIEQLKAKLSATTTPAPVVFTAQVPAANLSALGPREDEPHNRSVLAL